LFMLNLVRHPESTRLNFNITSQSRRIYCRS
jgi:hypothetical protein